MQDPAGIVIGAVHPDPRGKYTHGGHEREHMFVIYSPGATVHVIRRDSKKEALQARGEAVQMLDERAGTTTSTKPKPKVRPRRKTESGEANATD